MDICELRDITGTISPLASNEYSSIGWENDITELLTWMWLGTLYCGMEFWLLEWRTLEAVTRRPVEPRGSSLEFSLASHKIMMMVASKRLEIPKASSSAHLCFILIQARIWTWKEVTVETGLGNKKLGFKAWEHGECVSIGSTRFSSMHHEIHPACSSRILTVGRSLGSTTKTNWNGWI